MQYFTKLGRVITALDCIFLSTITISFLSVVHHKWWSKLHSPAISQKMWLHDELDKGLISMTLFLIPWVLPSMSTNNSTHTTCGLYILFKLLWLPLATKNCKWATRLSVSACLTDHLKIVLTHWGQDKMTAISQRTFSNEFSWMKTFEF